MHEPGCSRAIEASLCQGPSPWNFSAYRPCHSLVDRVINFRTDLGCLVYHIALSRALVTMPLNTCIFSYLGYRSVLRILCGDDRVSSNLLYPRGLTRHHGTVIEGLSHFFWYCLSQVSMWLKFLHLFSSYESSHCQRSKLTRLFKWRNKVFS